MRYKRKLLGIITIITCMATTGCSTKGIEYDVSDKPNKETLVIHAFEGAYGDEFWREAVKLFEEAYPDVKVKLTTSTAISDITKPMLVGKTPPDLIYLPSNNLQSVIPMLIQDNRLEELTSVFNEPAYNETIPIKDKLIDGILDGNAIQPYGDKKIYLAPLYYNVTGLWYNENIFKEQGWSKPITWSDFFDIGDKASEINKYLFIYQGMYPGYLEAMFYPMVANIAGVDTQIFRQGSSLSEDVERNCRPRKHIIKKKIFKQSPRLCFLL